ncbi:MAG: hypothetical protein GX896_00590 [Clostridiales bacterium]|nr:hypothetical protein [Clostridiales bacterium]
MLSKLLLESPHDNKILRYSVKYYNAMGKLDKAEENAWKLLKSDNTVDNIVLYTDIIAQKLLNDNTFLTIYDEEDKEIISLLEKAEIAEEVAGQYDEDNPRYEDNLTKAAEYRKEANSVKVKRIINWLTSQTPLFGDQSGVIELQLSKLYAASGEDTKALVKSY